MRVMKVVDYEKLLRQVEKLESKQEIVELLKKATTFEAYASKDAVPIKWMNNYPRKDWAKISTMLEDYAKEK